MSEFNKVRKEPVFQTPSEMTAQTPLETPVDIGQLSGGEYQQFASETLTSKKKREVGGSARPLRHS